MRFRSIWRHACGTCSGPFLPGTRPANWCSAYGSTIDATSQMAPSSSRIDWIGGEGMAIGRFGKTSSAQLPKAAVSGWWSCVRERPRTFNQAVTREKFESTLMSNGTSSVKSLTWTKRDTSFAFRLGPNDAHETQVSSSLTCRT